MINTIYKAKLKERIKDLRDRLVPEKAKASVFRASSSGKCIRALWYMLNQVKPDLLTRYEELGEIEFLEKHEIIGRSYLVFDLGNLVEQQMVKVATENLTTFKGMQEEITTKIGNYEFKGHIDGKMNLNDDPKKEEIVVDFKSTNEINFKYRLPKGDIGRDYISQINIYMLGLGLNTGKFVYYNKNTSHLYEHVEKYKSSVIEAIRQRYDEVVKNTEPKRELLAVSDKNKQLKYPCTYCDYKETCLLPIGYKRKTTDKGIIETIDNNLLKE